MTERWKKISSLFLDSHNLSIDLGILEALDEIPGDDGFTLAHEVVLIYLSTTPQIVTSLEAAVGASEMTLASRAAHNLKSSSANIGALKLAELCQDLETNAAKKHADGTLASAVTNLSREFAKVRRDLGLFSKVSNGKI
jgi:HPt (histidine-containing phosphotransfer) domain-containing protein